MKISLEEKIIEVINKNIEGLSTYAALDGVVSYKLHDSWDVEEKRYPGNYIIYDNNFTSEDMGIWGYVQILNSEDEIDGIIEKDKEKLDASKISDYSILDEKIENDSIKKVLFKEKNENGVIYINTIYYKDIGDNKILKLMFNNSEKDKEEDYSIVYKVIINTFFEKE